MTDMPGPNETRLNLIDGVEYITLRADDFRTAIRGQEWAGMALVRENERLRTLLERAEEVNGELTVEREELRARLAESEAENDQWQKKLAETWAEIEPLRAALVQIENWVGRLPSNMGEAALVFEYIRQACSVLDQPKR